MRMKIAMVFPSRDSEKAISGFALTLKENIGKTGVDIDNITYVAGNPMTLFRQISRLKRYDVVHIQHEYNLLGHYGLPFFILYFMLLLGNCRIVTTMHTVLSLKEEFRGSRIRTFLRKMLYITQNRLIGWFSDSVIVFTNFLGDTLLKEYGVNKKKIVVFPQGIIEDAPQYGNERMKRYFKLSGSVYIMMGSMVPDKGHDVVIRQADKIGKTVLVVANPGPVNDRNSEKTRRYMDECAKIVKEKHLEKFVRFDVSDITDKKPEWWKYFSAADLMILPYKYGHGSGIFAHSMAARKPVIGSNVKFFNEISKNFGCVLVAKKEGDYPKVIRNAMNPSNYKKMVKECERYVAEYGLSIMANKHKKMYQRALKGN
jgi:glycosyltransferase involved in cell wall biosynthesis